MEIKKERKVTASIRLSIENNGEEVGRAYLCLATNDLHDRPFGLIEDVFVKEEFRGQQIGTKLISEIIKEAKKQKCYKLIATSRYAREKVHKLYIRLGFIDWGKEFRMNL